MIDCLPTPSMLLEYSRTSTPSKISRRQTRRLFLISWLTRYHYFTTGHLHLDCLHFQCEIWETAIVKRDPSALTKFLVITFADLKKYKFFYWFAFPAFVSKPAWEITNPGWTNASEVFSPEAVGPCRMLGDFPLAKGLLAEIDSSASTSKPHGFLPDKI